MLSLLRRGSISGSRAVPSISGSRAVPGRSLCILSTEASPQFTHKSMYPQRERILYSFATSLHERQLEGRDDRVSLEELRLLCYRGTKIGDDEVDLLVAFASKDVQHDDTVSLSAFVRRVATELLPPPKEKDARLVVPSD